MNTTFQPRLMSTQDFALLGVNDVAYVRSVRKGDKVRFAIHAADGTEFAILDDREVAFALVRQHDLEPVSVH